MDSGVRARNVAQTKTKLWEWPTVLSLDAPLIAVLWQALFAQVFGVSLAWYHVFLLAAPVWLVYSADRLFDGWQRHPEDAQTRRHRFYIVYRKEVVGVWLAVLALSLLAALLTLRPIELLGGLLVLGATLGYLARLHLSPGTKLIVPKEVQVALLFGAGVALFLVPNLPLSWATPWHIIIPLALFTLLCALNCAFISHWEAATDTQQHLSLLRYSHLERRLLHVALALTCTAALFTFAFSGAAPLYGAVAGSALALFELERTHLGPAALRVLGDAALLTPAPLLVVFWLI